MRRRRKKVDGQRVEIPEGGPARTLTEEAERDRYRTADGSATSAAGFAAREGDTLTVKYDGAKLQIAPYTTVDVDSAIYSRHLRPGDDPEEEFERVYAYLERKCIEKARKKLAAFADELHAAKERAGR